MTKRLIIPGLGGSGPRHWQRWWLTQDAEAEIVEQDDWQNPYLKLWLYRLAVAVRNHPGAILIGHSLGALLIPHLVARYPRLHVGGALLVAPADVENDERLQAQAVGFAPIPTLRLPFPSIVVSSTNDRHLSVDRAQYLAAHWGSRLVSLGNSGHINVASGHGAWPAGLQLARRLAADAPKPVPGRRHSPTVPPLQRFATQAGG